jgi:hypothetical protein
VGRELWVDPEASLKAEEREFLLANAVAVADALRAQKSKPPADTLVLDIKPTTKLDDLVQRAIDADEAALLRRTAPRRMPTLFRTTSGDALPLRYLSPEDVHRLVKRGAMNEEEVRQWARMRLR